MALRMFTVINMSWDKIIFVKYVPCWLIVLFSSKIGFNCLSVRRGFGVKLRLQKFCYPQNGLLFERTVTSPSPSHFKCILHGPYRLQITNQPKLGHRMHRCVVSVTYLGALGTTSSTF